MRKSWKAKSDLQNQTPWNQEKSGSRPQWWFCKGLNIENVNTVEEYKEYIKKTIESEKKVASESKFEADLVDKVCEGAKVGIPEVLIEQRKRSIIR